MKTKNIESLEEIAERIALEVSNEHGWPGANPDLPIKQWNVLFVQALITDPAILDHIPAVKALREDNAKAWTAVRGSNQLSIDERKLQARIKELESQLTEIRQGGEAVAEIVVGDDGSQTWLALKTQWFKAGAYKLYTRPQPAIPPGYAVVPDALTHFMREQGNAALFNGNGSLDAAYKAMLAAAPSIPVAEKEARAPLAHIGWLWRGTILREDWKFTAVDEDGADRIQYMKDYRYKGEPAYEVREVFAAPADSKEVEK